MRRALTLLALLGGCGCEEPSLVPVAVAPEAVDPAAVGAAPSLPLAAPTLPRVGRSDLPTALPSVAVEVTAGGYRVTNRALVETWPAPERAEAAAHAPPGAPDFPLVEREVLAADPAPLLVPALSEALGLTAQADRARAASAGGGPRVVSVRAAADVRWERVVRVLYAAAQHGYAEPWLVVATEAGERVLPLAMDAGPIGADVRATIAEALAGLEGLGAGVALPADPAAVLDTAEAAQPTLWLRRSEDGLSVRRSDLGPLGPDCRTPASPAAPTLPPGADGPTLAACLDAAGPFTRAVVEASPELAFGAVVPVIEALVGRAPVAIGLGPATTPETGG
jgi:hypothetical protein